MFSNSFLKNKEESWIRRSIKLCTGINSISQFHSKLNKLLIMSEDAQLKKLIFPATQLLLNAHQDLKTSKKISVHFEREPYLSLLNYCGACLKVSNLSGKLLQKLMAGNHHQSKHKRSLLNHRKNMNSVIIIG
jgi:hypothetical protein